MHKIAYAKYKAEQKTRQRDQLFMSKNHHRNAEAERKSDLSDMRSRTRLFVSLALVLLTASITLAVWRTGIVRVFSGSGDGGVSIFGAGEVAPDIIVPQEAPRETREQKLERARNARGIYITQSTVRSKKMEELFTLIKDTELNAVVIDVKDGDGVFFDDKLKEWISRLKKEKIWLIARVMVFQDNKLAKDNPKVMLHNKQGGLWKNYRGWYWVDPASQEAWKYNLDVVKQAIDYGFDEVNFDYIRFPSDGALSNIVYPFWDGVASKSVVMTSFFKYMDEEVEQYNPDTMLSIDVFGYVFLTKDINIGQDLSMMLPYFDFVCPMVYPSHYYAGNFGFANPAEHPYEVIQKTFEKQKAFLDEQGAVLKVRPWLQAFDMGAAYDARMVDLEKKAAYDFGLSGWLLWNARNTYRKSILEPEETDNNTTAIINIQDNATSSLK